MNSKLILQTLSALLYVAMAIAIYFLFSSPLLRFASEGAVGHIPTQIFVLLIRVLAVGIVPGFLWLGVYFTYRSNMLGICANLTLGIYFLVLGVGMRMGSPFIILGICTVSVLPILLKRFKPLLLALGNKYTTSAPSAPAEPLSRP